MHHTYANAVISKAVVRGAEVYCCVYHELLSIKCCSNCDTGQAAMSVSTGSIEDIPVKYLDASLPADIREAMKQQVLSHKGHSQVGLQG